MIRPHPGSLKPVAPELIRLRAAMRLDFIAYGHWIDAHQQDVALLIATTPLEEEVAPVLRAAYIHEHWNSR